MKKRVIFLLIQLMCLYTCYSQENAIIISNTTVKNQLPTNVSQWQSMPATILVVAQTIMQVGQSRLAVQIIQGDRTICGTTAKTGITVDSFKVRTFQAPELTASFNNCEALKPGNHTLCVQFFNMDGAPVSQQVCKPFTVSGGTDNKNYVAPKLITPEDGKSFTEKELQRPVTLRWSGTFPKPPTAVKYKVRAWKVLNNQSKEQAISTSQAVIEKDVENITQTIITSGLYPCSDCSFAWNVQATDAEGNPYGENNGTSEVSSFNINNEPVAQNRPTGITPIRINPCIPGGPSWNFGGNNFTAQPHPAGITQADVGTCDDVDFILKSNGNPKIWLKGTAGNEYIGVGTEYPNRKLSINGDVSIGLGYNNNGVGSNGIEILGGGQVPTRRGISTDGDPNGHFDFFINNWQSANGIPEFRFKNGIAPGNTIAINSASAPDLMKIDGNGRVTINNFYANSTDDAFVINVGSTNYTNFKIKKNGYVYAREINVMPTATPFPDYVFDKDYNLMSLSNLEHYIATNKHLPNIPNAKAVEKEGINVGEMQIKQMEKIEEAFLYILELKKENEQLRERLQNLENKKSN